MSHDKQIIFEKIVVPVFAQEFPDVHYTYDMFTNLVRPKESQDKRVLNDYWEKKSTVGQECLFVWKQVLSSTGMHQQDRVEVLVKRLKKWYNQESARGLVENPNSRGTESPRKKAFDLEYLQRICPSEKWDIAQCKRLYTISDADNVFVAMMKRKFKEAYNDRNDDALRLWEAERNFFYKNRTDIIDFLSGQGISGEDRVLICSFLRFSDNYSNDRRQSFEKRYGSLCEILK